MKILKGLLTTILLAVAINIWAISGDILVTWIAPSEREDGSVLQLSEIAGYHIYYGTTAGDYQNTIIVTDPTAMEYTMAGMPPATYYIVLTTIDTDGRESQYSTEIIITVDPYLAPPKPITNLLLYVGVY